MDHSSLDIVTCLKRLTDSVCGFGESFVQIGVDMIPSVKEAQNRRSEIDKLAQDMFSRPRDLLVMFSKRSSHFCS